MLAALAPDTQRATTWEKLPHPPQVLQAIVKVNVKGMLYNEAIEWVAGARIRPWVVVALLHHLIDLQHPMCSSPLSADDAKAAVTQRVTVTYGVEETGPLVEMKNAPSPAMKSEASEVSKPKPEKAGNRNVEAEAVQSLAHDPSVSAMKTCLSNEVGAKTRSQSSAQAATGVTAEQAPSQNRTGPPTMTRQRVSNASSVDKVCPQMISQSLDQATMRTMPALPVIKAGAKKMSQSSAQAAAGVSAEPAASVTTVVTASLASPSMCQPASELQSKEASTVNKGCPQMTSQSGDQATMHAMQALTVNKMEAEKLSQSSAQAAAEVPSKPASSQKQQVPATTPSQGRSQAVSAKPEQDASPGNNYSPQESTASTNNMESTGQKLRDLTSAPLSPSGKVLVASVEASQQRPQKHATPEAGAETALDGQAFIGSVRPNVLSQDYTGAEWKDPDVDMLLQLSNAIDTLTIRTGHTFWDQWQNDFLPWAFPFSIPAPVSGPDFPHKARPRRPEEAPHLQPLAHLKLLAGRIESSIRNSWDLIPGLRRLTFKWQSVWQGSLWRKWKSQRQAIAPVPTLKWVQAARGLYNKLRSGTYITAGGKPKPIQFDTRKLPYARGLTTDEKELLQDVKGMQGHMPGTIEVRRRIGRFLFGARVEMGEPLFITISPTTRHNTLCIKFSRYRAADPGGAEEGARDRPKLWDTAEANIEVPPYDTRRQLTARDPWAVSLSFQTVVRCIFAKLLGIRLCFRCPACDCRDARGHGCHVTGGILGMVNGLCGAIEYQANSTPHFHCNVYIASIWQQSLRELAAKLNDSTITVEDVHQFLTWTHSESHPDIASHTQQQDHLEADWAQNNCKSSHDFFVSVAKIPCRRQRGQSMVGSSGTKAGISRRKSFHPPIPSSSTKQDQPSANSLASVERRAEVSLAHCRLQKEGGAKQV